MEYLQRDPLPEVCQNCREEECYNCDYALERWYLPESEEERLRQILHNKAIERYQRQRINRKEIL